ncbi:MAG: response regulator [bacterium]|nr:response regulator [bacterium]
MSEKKILVVEDSLSLRKVLVERLHDAGFNIVEAGSGEEGIRLAQAEKPDMIITDVIMYPVDGLEMAKRIREFGSWGEKVHIITLTNQNSDEEKLRVDPLHLAAYLVKADTSLDEVVKTAERMLKEKK